MWIDIASQLMTSLKLLICRDMNDISVLIIEHNCSKRPYNYCRTPTLLLEVLQKTLLFQLLSSDKIMMVSASHGIFPKENEL